jgi:ferredoxin
MNAPLPRPSPPMAMLAELTHRCPLSCPYCSNPVELSRKHAELSTDAWIATFREAAALGVLHVHLSGGEPASRPDLVPLVAAARDAGLYTNLITSGIGLTERRVAELDAGWPRPRPALHPGHRRRHGRPRRRLPRRLRPQDAGRRLGPHHRTAAHRQRGDAQAEPRPPRGDDRACRDARRPAARGRHRPVPRLGRPQPRRPDADPRPGDARPRDRARRPRAPEGHPRHRLRARRPPRPLPQGLHGRLGLHRPQRHPRRQRAALPRRPDHSGADLRAHRLPAAQGDLGDRVCLHGLPRHRLDAGALPFLRAQDGRFRRLPLPGDGARRRSRRRPTRSAPSRRTTPPWSPRPRPMPRRPRPTSFTAGCPASSPWPEAAPGLTPPGAPRSPRLPPGVCSGGPPASKEPAPMSAEPKTITFTLDGREVAAGPGETIWQVAKRAGARIPHLCHKDAPGYRPDGNCRACMVEIDGERVLAASCIRKPLDGMVVHTATERADKARRMVMELLLADQPTARRRATARATSGPWPTSKASPPAASLPNPPTRSRSSTPATSPCASTSTPASTATSASAPAARSRSTT